MTVRMKKNDHEMRTDTFRRDMVQKYIEYVIKYLYIV